MEKVKENDSKGHVCDDCINNCKQKLTGCSDWKKNTLENKYERILCMGVGRSGLLDENSIIAKAIKKQVAQQPIIQGLGQRYAFSSCGCAGGRQGNHACGVGCAGQSSGRDCVRYLE